MSDPTPDFIADRVVKSRYFFLDLQPESAGELTVVCGGREQCEPGYHVRRRRLPYSAIEYVAGGAGCVTLGDGGHARAHTLRTGSVFAYSPRTAHAITSDAEAPLVKYFVDFVGRDAAKLLRRVAPDPAGPPRQLAQTRWLGDLFDQLIETGSRHPRPAAAGHAALLLRTIVSRLALDARPVRQAESVAYETYLRCRHAAEESFAELPSVAAWASACHLDPAYLARLFQRFDDRSPHGHLQELKVRHAADLLARRGLSVKAAGAAVGFDDPHHFSRVFKKVHGLPPTRFITLLGRGAAADRAD